MLPPSHQGSSPINSQRQPALQVYLYPKVHRRTSQRDPQQQRIDYPKYLCGLLQAELGFSMLQFLLQNTLKEPLELRIVFSGLESPRGEFAGRIYQPSFRYKQWLLLITKSLVCIIIIEQIPPPNFNALSKHIRLKTMFGLQQLTQLFITIKIMIVNRLLRYAFSGKQEFNRFFILRLRFNQDGYYESSQYRADFVASLRQLQKSQKAIVLGGDSFPFRCTTFFINCDQEQTAVRFSKENIFTQKGIATAELNQIQRVSTPKFGNVANFYQMKVDI